MELQELISNLIVDTKGAEQGVFSIDPASSIGMFLPEIVLCGTIVLMLLLRLIGPINALDRVVFKAIPGGLTSVLAFAGLVYAFILTDPFVRLAEGQEIPRVEIFTGMLVIDAFTFYMRAILFGFGALFIVFISISGLPDREDSPDVLTLVLGAILGMLLMCSANHLMMIFMAVEMASVPSYALAGMMKGRRVASEAALKYAVYGAGAAGVMLYGISLIAGVVNTAHLPTIAIQLAERISEMPAQEQMAIVLGALMLMAGLAFKLSAFPFHFWAPDVFEGASAEVGAFLSVASKAGALALLVRVAIGFSTPVEATSPTEIIAAREAAFAAEPPVEAEAAGDAEDSAAVSVADKHQVAMFDASEEVAAEGEEAIEADGRGDAKEATLAGLTSSRAFLARLIALFAALTCTFGNLAAYGQTNIKRLLSYSTIAHAGYMMMAVPPMIALIGVNDASAQAAISALGVYIAVYLFMNLGAFAVVAFLRNQMRSEDIADYSGLIKQCPVTVVCFALMLFSLVGLPPLAGFIGKFAVFASLAEGYRATSETYLLGLLLIGGVNTAISLFYYLRVVKVMTLDPEPESRTPFAIGPIQGAFILVISLPTVLLILSWDWLNTMAGVSSGILM